QIAGNLISNAAKYSPAGSQIDVNLSEKSGRIELEVSDRGDGISDKEKASIFDPFYRGNRTENVSGTGLGLSIVKRCVEAMNGSIGCSDREGGGTTFRVSIPNE
ncbi:MAG: sensor histidine kinase, partial [Candidatus Kapaibacterium sp.]